MRDRTSTNTAKKKKNSFWFFEIFFQWPAHPVFSGKFSFFWRCVEIIFFFLGGGGVENWLASDHPGACTSMSHPFLARQMFVILRKRRPNKKLFLGRPACMNIPSAELRPQALEAFLMLPSQALLLLCHLDNDLVIYPIILYTRYKYRIGD